MNRLTALLQQAVARVAAWFKGTKDEHEYEFRTGQTLFITTDLGRVGVVRGRRYDESTSTESYLIERENGAREWYPRFSLCTSKEQIADQPTSREIQLTPEQAAALLAKGPQ